ncbi:hypothetical protein [Actinomadura sp. 9N215]|uniref:hypothetical protein n=1 Tax=Actinomadura sp. 9N215 TaxID=3375150 RepID=UPI0037BC8F84
MTTAYFDELAGRLRDSGVPEEEVAGTVDDLAAYIAESGADPDDEFGTPEEFAARLVPSEGGRPPEPSDETWRRTADAFQDRRMLNRYGDEGWEAERVDSVGRDEYFKRPKAASHGPDADLRIPPKRFFWSRRFYVFISCYFGFWTAVCVAWVAFAPAESRSRFLIGSLVGLVVAALAAGVSIWQGGRRSR